MLRKYSMNAASEVAAVAAKEIEAYLRRLPGTVEVLNVEQETEYQQQDVDLLWWFKRGAELYQYKIEVKGDQYHQTGNYFFETISNETKNTPGCFLYTTADYIFYYFVAVRELHVLPMPATRAWFLTHEQEFVLRATSTPVGKGKIYKTIGRLVPRKRVKQEVPGVKIIPIKEN